MFMYRQNSCTLKEIGIEEHDGDVKILTGSRNLVVLRMRNDKYEISPIFMAKWPKYLHLVGNRGRRAP